MAAKCNDDEVRSLDAKLKPVKNFTEEEIFALITDLAKVNNDFKTTRSGTKYGGRKHRSKKGGANKALVHSICMCIVSGTVYGSWTLGIAAAESLGWFEAAQRGFALAKASIAGCGDLATGLARSQASDMAQSAGISNAMMACSSAWGNLEAAQRRLIELSRMYGFMATNAGLTISVTGYSRLYSFVEQLIDSATCDISGHNELPEKKSGSQGPNGDGGSNPQTVQGGTRRRRTYKKKHLGKLRRKKGGRSRRRKSRKSCGGRKSRRRKGRKSCGGRKSRRGRKSSRRQ